MTELRAVANRPKRRPKKIAENRIAGKKNNMGKGGIAVNTFALNKYALHTISSVSPHFRGWGKSRRISARTSNRVTGITCSQITKLYKPD
ncbi:hypothetical protein PSCICN_05730 [Pseudomonas cichorii]|nr:hypothetical protein PSCICN_05730 [Pseudomonas cichorii]